MQPLLTGRAAELHAQAGATRLNIGHRGARALAPENTLAAFQKALDLGCHMVELDVHCTRDGVLLVHHDDDLLRCTDVAARHPDLETCFVSDFTAAQIATLDAGTWFVVQLSLPATQRAAFLRSLTPLEQSTLISAAEMRNYASGAVRVPTLAQVLELLEPSPMLVNVEIKALPRMYPGIAAQVLDCLRHHGMEHRTLLSSFDHEQLSTARALSSRAATAVLTSDRLARPARYLELLDADAYHPSCSGEQDSLGFHSVARTLQCAGIAEVLAQGKAVNTWTCNDPAQMRQLLAAGLTGIFTDYPHRLTALLSAVPDISPES